MSAVDILRDALFGSPPSPTKEPSREGVLAAFTLLNRVTTGVIAGIVYYATGAERAADTAQPLGTIGKAANEDDYYRREGAGWVVDNTVYEGVASLVQPQLDEAVETSAEAKATAESLAASAILIDVSAGTPNASLGGGAAYIFRGGAITGLSVPNGSTGQGALLTYVRDSAIKPLAGSRVRMTVKLKVSASFDRAMTFEAYSYNAPSGVTLLGPIGAESLTVVDGVLTYSAVFDLPSAAVGFQVSPRITSTAAASGVQTVEGLSVTFAPIEVADGVSRADAAINTRLRQVYAQVETRQRSYGRVALVTAPGEGGEFTSIKAAIAALQPHATRSSRALLRIAPKPGGAAYQEREIGGDFIDLVSASPGTMALIDGSQPNNAPPADISANSTFSQVFDMRMEWIEGVIANGRYVHHWDYNGSIGKLWETRNCRFWHKGNEGARQYQISQGHDPDTFGTPYYIWRGTCAIGAGIWDDCRAEHYDTEFLSPNSTVTYHDQVAAPYGTRGSTLLFDGCVIEAGVTVNPANGVVTRASQTGGNPSNFNALEFGSYGQPATSKVILRNNPFIFGKIVVAPIGPSANWPDRSKWVFDGEGNDDLIWDVHAHFAGGVAAVSRVL